MIGSGALKERIDLSIARGEYLRTFLRPVRGFYSRNKIELGVLAFFLALSIALTYPLIVNLSSHITICCDAWLYHWYIWWTQKSLFGLRYDQFYTDFIYYPVGVQLYFESLYNSIIGAALSPLTGTLAAFNLLYLSTYVLGAFGSYLLVLRLTGDRKASIAGAVVFVFSGVRIQNLHFLNMSTIQWIPFLALWFLKTIDRPTAKNGFITALFYFLVVLSSGYYAVSSGILLLIILLWSLVENHKKILNAQFGRAFAVFGAAFLLMTVPVVYPVLKESLSGESVLTNSYLTPLFSSDLAAFFVPSRFNPIYDEYVSHIYPLFITHITEWESYLGIVAVTLGIIGMLKSGLRHTGLWLVIFGAFAIISLGPHLQILGKQFDDTRLPFYYLQQLPVVDSMRSPKRFLVTGMLGLAVLAGFGTRYLLSTKLKKPILSYAALALIVTAVIADFWGIPRTLWMTDATVPPFFHQLAEDPRDMAIVHIPLTSQVNPVPLNYQTVHEKRLIGGYVERPLPEAEEFINSNRFLAGIRLPGIEEKTEITPEETRDAHRLFEQFPEIEYIVFTKTHLFYPPELKSFALYRPWLESNFGLPVYEDDLIAAYRVKGNSALANQTNP